MTLYIIGNGFDLRHGIKSRYENFKEYAWKHCGSKGYYLGVLEQCYHQVGANGELVLWSDLERALGNPDIAAVQTEATEDIEYEEGHEIRYQPAMEDAAGFLVPDMFSTFHSLFEEWVNSIDITEAVRIPNLKHFDSDGLFLSFNYTDTLESVYGIPRNQINYIHGRRNSNDEIIVGHCSEVDANAQLPNDPMIYDYQAYDTIADLVNEERKKVPDIIRDNQDYWTKLNTVDKVVVYGHSLADVDMPYLMEIANSVLHDAEWYFSIYYRDAVEKQKECDRVNRFISEAGLDVNKCHTFQM